MDPEIGVAQNVIYHGPPEVVGVEASGFFQHSELAARGH